MSLPNPVEIPKTAGQSVALDPFNFSQSAPTVCESNKSWLDEPGPLKSAAVEGQENSDNGDTQLFQL